MALTRRAFAGGLLAAGGWGVLPRGLFAAEGRPRLRFGVVSDVHIGGRKESPQRLEFALRWLAKQGVEAVLFPGDIAHSGRIHQMEQFAAIWYKVFPNGRLPDGGKVELMLVTGNHDAWEWGLDRASEEQRRKDWLFYKDNAARTWERLFGEKWAPVWRKEVKGYTFIGAQWPTFKPELEKFMAEHGKEFDPAKPFFHCQHEHPVGTCHGKFGCGWDRGQSVRAFANYPNAVVFSGHSHCTITDERAVWQGAFTSIGSGCLHEGGMSFDYANCAAFWHPSMKKNLMGPMNDPDAWGGDPAGGCFELVDVFDGHLRIQRRSSVCDLPVGEDWIVPLPARKGGPFDFAKQAAAGLPPEFPEGAKVGVAFCPKGHPLEGVSFKGKPCVSVRFPAARRVAGGRRVFDYVVEVAVPGGKPFVRTIQAPGFSSPEKLADVPGECLFLPTELPAAKGVVVSVTPRDCFERKGRTIVSAPFEM